MKLRTVLLLVFVLLAGCAGLIVGSFYLALAPDPDTLGGEFHESMQSVAFSPDGTTLISGNSSGSIRVWDVASRTERRKALHGHTQRVTSLSFTPDGKTLASASDDGTIVLWDMISGVQSHLISGDEVPHRDVGKDPAPGVVGLPDRQVKAVAFSPDGKTLAFGGDWLVLWDAAARKTRLSLKASGPVQCLQFTADGKRVAVGGDRGIVLWDVETGKETAVVYERGKGSTPLSLSLSPDGKAVAWAGDDQDVFLWDVEGRKEIAKLSGGHTDRAISVAFHPDGKLLAAGDRGEQTILWDVAAEKPVTFRQQSFKALMGSPGGPVTAVAFSADGKWLATAGGPIVKLWEVARLVP
jgi:WD40 repeat protein